MPFKKYSLLLFALSLLCFVATADFSTVSTAAAGELPQLIAEQTQQNTTAAQSTSPGKKSKTQRHVKDTSRKKTAAKKPVPAGADSGTLAEKLRTHLAGGAGPGSQKQAAKVSGTLSNSLHDMEGMKSAIKNPKGFHYILSPAGTPRMIKAEDLSAAVVAESSKSVAKAAGDAPDKAAREFLRNNRKLLKLTDPDTELTNTKSSIDELGITRHRYQQQYKGLPVWGSELSIYENSARAITLFNGNYLQTPKIVDVKPLVSSAEAIQKVITDLNLQAAAVTRQDAALVIWHDDNARVDYLVWHVEVAAGPAVYWHYFVDAGDGTMRNRYSGTVQGSAVPASGLDAKGIARNFTAWQEGGVYSMLDVTRPVDDGAISSWQQKGDIWVTDLGTGSIFSSSSANSGWNPAAVSLISNIYAVLDYFKNTHGLIGYSSSQQNIQVRINGSVAADGYPNNAFFSGQDYTLNFGQGDGSNFNNLAIGLDVVAHEFGHGVVASTAALIYQNQSGALNESFADFFGAMVDRDDWIIGEDVYLKNGTVMRDMRNPRNGSDGGQPATMSEFIVTAEDHGAVHSNSGIPNRAAWLVAEGLTAEGLGSSIAKEKTEKIWYRALTTYMHPNDRFIEARRMLIQAAIDLYGDSAEAAAVRTAWDTVGVTDALGGVASSATPTSVDPLPGSDWLVTVFGGGIYVQSATGGIGPINTVNARPSRPAVVVGSDDTYILYVDDVVNDLRAISFATEADFVFDSTYFYWSIAIAQSGGKIAYTKNLNEPYLYIVDYNTLVETPYLLAFQTDGGTAVGNIQFADALSFDFMGRKLIFDAVSTFASAGLPAYSSWTIGILDLDTGVVSAPIPPQVKGVDIGNPVFAANNNYVIAFDYFDNNTYENAVVTYNLAANIADGLGVIAYSGPTDLFNCYQPYFNGADDAMVFRYEPISGNSSIRTIPITVNGHKWQGNQPAMSLFSTSLGSYPLVFRNSVRPINAGLAAAPTTLNFGTLSSGSSAKRTFILHNTGNIDLTLKDMTLSGTGFTHNGTLGLLPRSSTMTVEVTYTAPQTAGAKTGALTILSDAAAPNNTVQIQFSATVNGTVNSYTVTFNSNGGSAVASQNVTDNSVATQPAAPTKTGATFAGWYSNSDLTTAFAFTTPVTTNTTLYAKWSANSYTVTFNSNGGSAVVSQSVPYNTVATQPAAPARTGYTFAGWYADSGLTAVFAFTTPVTTNTALYAKWTATAPINIAPLAASQSVVTDVNVAKLITLTATDANGDTLNYAIVSPPVHGSLTGTPPTVTYTPANGYSGSDTFTFKANDGTADSTNATVTITITSQQPLLQLPRTGQTSCYGPPGPYGTSEPISCSGTGQDGDLRKGAVWPNPRFTITMKPGTSTPDGTVTDNLTGLVWLKDYTTCGSSQTWVNALTAANSLTSGSCGLADGSTAGTWRVPNINELKTLFDMQNSGPAFPTGHPFTGIYYAASFWSSTTANGMVSPSAWVVSYQSGGQSYSNKTSTNPFMLVKGSSATTLSTGQTLCYDPAGAPLAACTGSSGQDGEPVNQAKGVAWSESRFKSNSDGTMTDLVTGLTWLKNGSCSGSQKFIDALAWSNSLAAGTVAATACNLTDGSVAGDWRLPNRTELMSLINYAKTGYSASSPNNATWLDSLGFTVVHASDVNQFYGTSTTSSNTGAWQVDLRYGTIGTRDKGIAQYVLPVKGNPVVSTNILIIEPIPTLGTVTADLSGINCGATGSGECSQAFAAGTSVTLTATPTGDNTFSGWTGGGCSGTGSCTVTMDMAKTVTANFTVTVIATPGVCGSANGSTLSSVPSADLCSSGTPSSVTGSGPWAWTCAGSNGGATANCSASVQTYTLIFQADANGTLTGNSSQTVNHGAATTAVTAVPATGYHFVNWTGSNGFVTTTANPLTVSSVTSALTITANFAHDAVNGVCGSASGNPVVSIPSANLCGSASTPSAVSGSGPWAWSCGGSYGGTDATCTANKLTITALPGDCNSDSSVSIAEVQSAINMFLGVNTVGTCVDTDGNSFVSIAEVQMVINGFLGIVPLSNDLVSIELTPATTSIISGAGQKFTATGRYSDNSTRPLSSVVWTSSDTTKATIATTGLATAVAPGTTTITVMSGNVFKTATLTIATPEEQVALIQSKLASPDTRLSGWLAIYDAIGMPVLQDSAPVGSTASDDPIGIPYWLVEYSSSLDKPTKGLSLDNAGRMLAAILEVADSAEYGQSLLDDLRLAAQSNDPQIRLLGLFLRERILQGFSQVDILSPTVTPETAFIDLPSLQLIFWDAMRSAQIESIENLFTTLPKTTDKTVAATALIYPKVSRKEGAECSEFINGNWANLLLNKLGGGVPIGIKKSWPSIIEKIGKFIAKGQSALTKVEKVTSTVTKVMSIANVATTLISAAMQSLCMEFTPHQDPDPLIRTKSSGADGHYGNISVVAEYKPDKIPDGAKNWACYSSYVASAFGVSLSFPQSGPVPDIKMDAYQVKNMPNVVTFRAGSQVFVQADANGEAIIPVKGASQPFDIIEPAVGVMKKFSVKIESQLEAPSKSNVADIAIDAIAGALGSAPSAVSALINAVKFLKLFGREELEYNVQDWSPHNWTGTTTVVRKVNHFSSILTQTYTASVTFEQDTEATPNLAGAVVYKIASGTMTARLDGGTFFVDKDTKCDMSAVSATYSLFPGDGRLEIAPVNNEYQARGYPQTEHTVDATQTCTTKGKTVTTPITRTVTFDWISATDKWYPLSVDGKSFSGSYKDSIGGSNTYTWSFTQH